MILEVVQVGRGFLFLYPDALLDPFKTEFPEVWQRHFPNVPLIVMEYAKLKYLGDEIPMFEFSGDMAPEQLDAFRAWWEEARKWPEATTSRSSTGQESEQQSTS